MLRRTIALAVDGAAAVEVVRDTSPDVVLMGLQMPAVHRGESPLHHRAARELIGGMRGGNRLGPTGRAPDSLTERESKVLVLVRQGLTNKQIARRLGIA